MIRRGGAASSRRIAPLYHNLYIDWATMAMRLACAAHKGDSLSIEFEASEIMCLAELLKQEQNLQKITVFGEAMSTSIREHYQE